jgi:phosphoheptose isomerase
MKFPYKKYFKIHDYSLDYNQSYRGAFDKIDLNLLENIAKIIKNNYSNQNSKIIVGGNGGSTALANHFETLI